MYGRGSRTNGYDDKKHPKENETNKKKTHTDEKWVDGMAVPELVLMPCARF